MTMKVKKANISSFRYWRIEWIDWCESELQTSFYWARPGWLERRRLHFNVLKLAFNLQRIDLTKYYNMLENSSQELIIRKNIFKRGASQHNSGKNFTGVHLVTLVSFKKEINSATVPSRCNVNGIITLHISHATVRTLITLILFYGNQTAVKQGYIVLHTYLS